MPFVAMIELEGFGVRVLLDNAHYTCTFKQEKDRIFLTVSMRYLLVRTSDEVIVEKGIHFNKLQRVLEKYKLN